MRIFFITLCLSISFAFANSGAVLSSELQKASIDNVNDLEEWKTLAQHGDLDAQFYLATLYREGKGVPQDYKIALRWFTLAAEQGNAEAQYNLGIMHSFGLGVVPDYKKAVKWYKLAAEQGDAFAQYNLGRLYYLGQGVIEDLVYAYMWANQASSNGFEMGEELRGLLTELMTPPQIEAAQRLARACVKKNFEGC